VDINLIPFSMVDHIDILKDGASAVYGTDAVAGVINIFLIHKFRGLEIGGSYGNTNMGASNDARELEAWIKAGTGDDKTDIVIIADAYDRAAIYSRDRNISSNGNAVPWGGFDARTTTLPGRIGSFRLIPRLFFSANSPPPHSAPNVSNSPYYVRPSALGIGINGNLDGDYLAYNFAALTPSIPAADRQSFYGSFTRDICDKYLTVFADFKYTRSFFDSAQAATPVSHDAFTQPNGADFGPGLSVPIQNPFNPFTVADTTLIHNGATVPVTTGVRFRAINDEPVRTAKFTLQDVLFDAGLRGELGEVGDYFKNWNWELGFRYSRNNQEVLLGGVISKSGLREALLDTNPATAFNPFLGFFGRNSPAAISRVYVTLHNSGVFELPLGYFHLDGDLFNLPAGPVSFAIGLEYRGERWRSDPDSENTSFNTFGAADFEASRVNRDVWATYQEVRIPVTSPVWNFPGAYSLEFDIAEREEWYSQNTSAILASEAFPAQPAAHSQYNAQKAKVSFRWQPLDPKYIGALTLRGSYTEAFHAPALSEISPASTQSFAGGFDPILKEAVNAEARVIGNPNLHPEVAYELSYGAVYSPRWLKGLTLSADWWHIDMRSIASLLGAQFIIENNIPGLVIRGPPTIPGKPGPIILVIDPNENLTGAIFEGLDYEAIYILDSAIFGHGDFGRLTATLNGTWLSRAELQIAPDTKRFGIPGEVIPPGFTLTGSLPWSRANFSLFYDGPADTWMQGLDIGAVVHYTGQYEDDNLSLTASPTGEFSKPQTPRSGFRAWRARKVSAWTTLDLITSYIFNLPPSAPAIVPGFAKDGGKNVKVKDGTKQVIPVSTAEYSPCGWRAWLE